MLSSLRNSFPESLQDGSSNRVPQHQVPLRFSVVHNIPTMPKLFHVLKNLCSSSLTICKELITHKFYTLQIISISQRFFCWKWTRKLKRKFPRLMSWGASCANFRSSHFRWSSSSKNASLLLVLFFFRLLRKMQWVLQRFSRFLVNTLNPILGPVDFLKINLREYCCNSLPYPRLYKIKISKRSRNAKTTLTLKKSFRLHTCSRKKERNRKMMATAS